MIYTHILWADSIKAEENTTILVSTVPVSYTHLINYHVVSKQKTFFYSKTNQAFNLDFLLIPDVFAESVIKVLLTVFLIACLLYLLYSWPASFYFFPVDYMYMNQLFKPAFAVLQVTSCIIYVPFNPYSQLSLSLIHI